MRKRIGFGISILIILIGSVFIVGRANGNDELPFSIEETKFGIKDEFYKNYSKVNTKTAID